MKPSRSATLILACALALLPRLAHGQKFVNENSRVGGGCTGFAWLVRGGLLPGETGRTPAFQVRGYPTVEEVDSTSAAAKAGVAKGDSLVKVNGASVIDDPKILAMPAGATMKLTVKRGADLMDFVFTMGKRELATGVVYDANMSNASRTRCVASNGK